LAVAARASEIAEDTCKFKQKYITVLEATARRINSQTIKQLYLATIQCVAYIGREHAAIVVATKFDVLSKTNARIFAVFEAPE